MAKRTPEQMKNIREFDSRTYQLVQFKPKIAEAELIRAYVKYRDEESLTRFLVRAATTQIMLDIQADPKLKKGLTTLGLLAELDEIQKKEK